MLKKAHTTASAAVAGLMVAKLPKMRALPVDLFCWSRMDSSTASIRCVVRTMSSVDCQHLRVLASMFYSRQEGRLWEIMGGCSK